MRTSSRLVTGLHINHAVRCEPSLGDGGREKGLMRDAPQDLAPRARGDSCGEQRSRRAVNGAIAAVATSAA
jgi:hypothetical protein